MASVKWQQASDFLFLSETYAYIDVYLSRVSLEQGQIYVDVCIL